MNKETAVKGFKATESNMTCRGFQYEVGKTFKHDGPVEPCESGFHFCKDIKDICGYYDNYCRIFEVEASGVIVEDNLDDKTVTDTLTFVKEINYLEYVDHPNWWVRSVVACKGIGLDVLINDEDPDVRAFVAKQGYRLDKLISDSSHKVRIEVALLEYGLDVLVNDEDWRVRFCVAKRGYGLDILVNDKDPDVRDLVASQGYGLDILINDPDIVVRETAKQAKNRL